MVSSSVQAGRTYKVVSHTDHLVLDIKGAQYRNGNFIITYPYNTVANSNQNWKVENGKDGLVFKASADNKFVMDYANSDSSANVWEYHGGTNQLWNLVPIAPEGFTVYIVSLQNGRVLQNNGKSNAVTLVPKGNNNKAQWWNLIEV